MKKIQIILMTKNLKVKNKYKQNFQKTFKNIKNCKIYFNDYDNIKTQKNTKII